MKISDKLVQAINEQIAKELYSSYLYLAMAADMEHQNYPGFAHWLKMHAREEHGHAMKLFDYLIDRGARVELEGLEKPPVSFGAPGDLFNTALEHEQKVSQSIKNLYELSVKENDYPTQIHLQWFITEQVEEEKTFDDVVNELKIVGSHPPYLMMMDRRMAARQG
jgi:ferritin